MIELPHPDDLTEVMDKNLFAVVAGVLYALFLAEIICNLCAFLNWIRPGWGVSLGHRISRCIVEYVRENVVILPPKELK